MPATNYISCKYCLVCIPSVPSVSTESHTFLCLLVPFGCPMKTSIKTILIVGGVVWNSGYFFKSWSAIQIRLSSEHPWYFRRWSLYWGSTGHGHPQMRWEKINVCVGAYVCVTGYVVGSCVGYWYVGDVVRRRGQPETAVWQGVRVRVGVRTTGLLLEPVRPLWRERALVLLQHR